MFDENRVILPEKVGGLIFCLLGEMELRQEGRKRIGETAK